MEGEGEDCCCTVFREFIIPEYKLPQCRASAVNDAAIQDMIPEDEGERETFERNIKLFKFSSPLSEVARILRLWHDVSHPGTYKNMCAVMANALIADHSRRRGGV